VKCDEISSYVDIIRSDLSAGYILLPSGSFHPGNGTAIDGAWHEYSLTMAWSGAGPKTVSLTYAIDGLPFGGQTATTPAGPTNCRIELGAPYTGGAPADFDETLVDVDDVRVDVE